MLLFSDALCAYPTFVKVKSVGLPGAAAAADEADSVMQPLSSPDDATSHRADAAFEYSNLPPDLSANERFCHMLLRNPPCFFRLPCLMTDDSSAEDIVFSLLRELQKQAGATFELQKGARGRGGGGGDGVICAGLVGI